MNRPESHSIGRKMMFAYAGADDPEAKAPMKRPIAANGTVPSTMTVDMIRSCGTDSVILPASSAQATPTENAPVYVTVQADLSLRVGEAPVVRDGLATALRSATHGDTSQRLYLRADQRVSYGDLMATLDALRSAGYLKVALVGLEQGAR